MLWLILDWDPKRPYGSRSREFFVVALKLEAIRMLSFIVSPIFLLDTVAAVESLSSIKLLALAPPYRVEPGGGSAYYWLVLTDTFLSSKSRKLLFSRATSWTLYDFIGGGPLTANLSLMDWILFSLYCLSTMSTFFAFS